MSIADQEREPFRQSFFQLGTEMHDKWITDVVPIQAHGCESWDGLNNWPAGIVGSPEDERGICPKKGWEL